MALYSRRWLFVFLLALFPTVSLANPDVHILSIGNGHYAPRPGEPAANVTGASISARLALFRLGRLIGAETAMLLHSKPDQLVSRADIFMAINDLIDRAKATENDDHLVVYYNGHGFGEGIAWNAFLQPGNVIIPAQLNEFDPELLAADLVYVAEIVHILEGSGMPYMLLIDACYEGENVSFASPVLTETAIGNLRDVAAILRFFNQFHGPNPVIFSAEPGTVVETVSPPPSAGLDKVTIGPLARRLALALEENGQNDLIVQTLVDRLVNSQLDNQTSPAVSHFKVGAFQRIAYRPTEVTVEPRVGTASLAAATPLSKVAPMAQNLTAFRDVRFARLQLNGPKGEWVLDGQTRELVLGQDALEVVALEAGEISLVFSGGGEDWDVSFAAPGSAPFVSGMTTMARRLPFQEEHEGGIEISGDGRGCNEIEGRFEVNEASFDADGLVRLDISFEQRCDGQSTLLTGSLQINFDDRF